MDKKELVESSSSQNVNISIVRITARGTSGTRFKLEMSDGSFFSVHADFLLENRLNKGFICDPCFIKIIESHSIYLKCREKAYELLSYRLHARKEIYLKLLKRGFLKSDINTILDELKEKNLLNDWDFAIKRSSSRMRKNPSGRSALIADLYQKGISISIANEAVDSQFCEQDYAQAIQKVAAKLSHKSSITGEKMARSLLRKGFSWNLVHQITSKEFK